MLQIKTVWRNKYLQCLPNLSIDWFSLCICFKQSMKGLYMYILAFILLHFIKNTFNKIYKYMLSANGNEARQWFLYSRQVHHSTNIKLNMFGQ